MPKFAVFFADDAAVGMTRVEASDAAAAEAQVLRDHPDGTVKAVGDEQVNAENRHRMLAKWMQTLNG
jgi:hypothetical protein